MKILFVIDRSHSASGIADSNIQYCLSQDWSVFVADIARTDSRAVRETLAAGHHVSFPDHSGDLAATDLDIQALLTRLRLLDFSPDIIEFYDEVAWAYLIGQRCLVNSFLPGRPKLSLNFTSTSLFQTSKNSNHYAIHNFFWNVVRKWLLLVSDTSFCYHREVVNILASESANDVSTSSIEKLRLLTSEANDVIRKWNDLSRVKNEAPKRYPFEGPSKEIPITESTPLLSVVIPFFNMGVFIQETVVSVLKSSYRPLEIIIVDDGSTDSHSLQVLQQLSADYSTVRVIRQENAGVAHARNNGIHAAKGEIIALLDADDIVLENYYEKAVTILTQFDNVSFVGCWTEFFNETGTSGKWITHTPSLPLYYLMNTINSQAIVVKKEALTTAGLHDPSLNMMLDDWESVIDMVSNDYFGIVIPEFLFRYRIRQNSVYRSNATRWTKSYQSILQKHFRHVDRHTYAIIMLLTVNGPNIFYKDPQTATDFYRMMNNVSNYRIRDSFLTRAINRYYNFVELHPLGMRLRNTLGKQVNRTKKVGNK